MTQLAINKPVDVTAVLFTKQFEALPRRIEFDGKTVTFIADSLKQYLKTPQSNPIYELSNGREIFRLKSENARWTLLEILRS